MLRARLRLAALPIWAALCAAAAWHGTQLDDNRPLLTSAPDCATAFDARLAPLRELLPARGVVGFVGPDRDSGCSPLMVSQYAFAPVYVVDQTFDSHRDDMAERGHHLLPEEPAFVIAWGAEGREWLRAHPSYRAVRARRGVVLAARDP